MTDTVTPTATPLRADRGRGRASSARSASTSWSTHAKRNGVRPSRSRRSSSARPPEAGLAGLPFPAEYGGGGLTLAHEKIWREVKGNYPMMDGEFIISHGMCLPMLNEYGTHEQKRQFLADNIAGRTMWCQMFSEPGAGSDVASLQTRAELDGDEWVVNGQKVWTTLAHKSRLRHRRRPHRPRSGEARRHLDVHHRHEGAGRRDPPDPPDRRRLALQRGVLHRRPHPEGLAGRRAQQRLEARHGDADVRARRDRSAPAPARSASRTSSMLRRRPRGDGPDRRPGRARPADADLVDGDHEVARGDEEPRRAEGRQDAGPRRFARQAVRLDHRVARARDALEFAGARFGGVGSGRPSPAATCSGSCSTRSSRASPAAPTRSSATSSATACSACRVNPRSTATSRSASSRSAPRRPEPRSHRSSQRVINLRPART